MFILQSFCALCFMHLLKLVTDCVTGLLHTVFHAVTEVVTVGVADLTCLIVSASKLVTVFQGHG